ncbi:hypothetical protein, partial [Haloparvum sedimenti]|uniref:hypothetical protein n=1 Tax=Haloparvum sedimenti TaxID=1678448 RepID=UPI0011471A6E
MTKVSQSHYEDSLLPVMKAVGNWICWAESHKGDSIPINPNQYRKHLHRYQPENYRNKDVWMQYDEARTFAENREAIDGIGFVTMGVDISYIDFDYCVDSGSNKVDPEIYELVQEID